MGRVLKTTFIMLIFSAVALAGCSDAPGPVDTEGEGAEPPEVQATDTTGGIRGVVVDQAIVPIEGATIKVLSTEITATTDANGAFAVSGLDAGTYFVEATHPLFHGQQASTEVKAGLKSPPAMKIVLQAKFDSAPFMETQFFDGYIVCSTNIDNVGYSEECGEGVGYPCEGIVPPDPTGTYECGDRIGRAGNSVPQIWFRTTSLNVSTFIIEQVWEPSVSAATGNTEAFWTRVAVDWICDPLCGGKSFGNRNDGTNGDVTSESPLLLRVDEAVVHDWESRHGPITPETDLSTFTYSGAENGVILEQPFEEFISVFYILEAPADWSFVQGDRSPYS